VSGASSEFYHNLGWTWPALISLILKFSKTGIAEDESSGYEAAPDKSG
jgi:hypothetical protein